MKRNKIHLLCLFMFFSINNCFAQPMQQGAVQSYTVPSPSVGAMNQYVETPVNLSTGVPAIEVPVYVAKSDNIEVPVSFSYHASGIKVNQNSTEVGLGWSLNAGGAITREVRGLPDPAYPDYYHQVGKYWNNGYLNPDNSDCDYEVLYTLDAGTTDGQPDIYTFNVNGDNFQFFKVPDVNGQIQFYTMPERNVIIQQNGNNWIITLENGTKYYFGNHRETTKIKNMSAGNGNVSEEISAYFIDRIEDGNGLNQINFSYENSFYEIDHGISQYSKYVENPAGPPNAFSFCSSGSDNYTTTIHGKQISSITFNNGVINFLYYAMGPGINNREDLLSSPVGVNYLNPRLKQITVSNAIGPVKIIALKQSYFNGNIAGASANLKRLKLDEITINEDAGTATPVSSVERYKFTYNEQIPLPEKTSFAQDHWGYYNGELNNNNLLPELNEDPNPAGIVYANPYIPNCNVPGGNPPNPIGHKRSVNPAFSQAGILTKVEYPTGGYTEYEYENNSFYNGINSYFTNTTLSVNAGLTKTAQTPVDPDGRARVNSQTFSIPANKTAYIKLIGNRGCPNNNDQTFYNHSDVKIIEDGNPNAVTTLAFTNNGQTGCNDGIVISNNSAYPMEYFVQVSMLTTGCYINATAYVYIDNPPNLSPQVNYVGGLRIRSIKNNDALTNKVKVTNYAYNIPGSSEISSQVFAWPSYKKAFKLYMNDLNNIPACNCNALYSSADLCSADPNIPSVAPCNWCPPQNPAVPYNELFYTAHNAYYWQSNSIDNLHTGNHIRYSYVTEIFGDYGENGKIVNHFSNFNTFNIAGSLIPLQRLGLLLDKKVYDNQDNLVSENSNTYTLVTGSNPYNNSSMFVGRSAEFKGHHAVGFNLNVAACPQNYIASGLKWQEYAFAQKLYSYYLEWVALQSSEEKLYDGVAPITKTTQYTYQNYATPLSKRHYKPVMEFTLNSAGTEVNTYHSYPTDFDLTNALLAAGTKEEGLSHLITKHILHAPMESYTELKTNGANSRITDAVHYDYKNTLIGGNPCVFPDKVFKIEINTPSGLFLPINKNISGTYNPDNLYKIVQKLNKYTDGGKIAETENNAGKKTAYIWDHENAYLTCAVTNAAETTIAYSSFETENKGKWVYNTNNVVTANNAFGRIPTGKNLYHFTQGNTPAPYNANENITWSNYTNANNNNMKKYVVSFWFYIDPNIPDAHVNVVYNNNDNIVYANGTTLGNNIKIVSDYSIGIKGFRYCELEVSMMYGNVNQALPDNFVIKGANAYIDELRLYPVESRMQTATYTPLTGVNDQCDIDNKIIYYNYDETTRLRIIRDQFGNIIQKNEYGIQSVD